MSVTGREPAGGAGDTKELRLALVCFGGASLAIYMHGVVKELNRLVRASALLEHAADERCSADERVYVDLLRALADRHPEHVRTRVVVDVIAGTSAGGINGVYLAKALARNESQDLLRDLWLERGDIDVLLDAPRWLPRPLRYLLVCGRVLWRSPLRGDGMSQWLYDALEGMDATAPADGDVPASLLPDDHVLELFVTATDFYGYDRQAVTTVPRLVHDRRHRHVLTFRLGPDGDDFARDGNGALAFAARTTSCFPGVFPPVSLGAFRGYLAGRGADLHRLERRLFREYELAGAKPGDTWFVDGGVLDNMPFGHAIAAIRERPADLEVDRKLLYLEPAPGGDPAPPEHPSPRPVDAILGALSGVPRHEPILDDLLDVAALNERVQRVADIVETSFDAIGELVGGVLGHDLTAPASSDDPALAAWSQALHAKALEQAGFSYATYVRLKISGVVDRAAAAVCGLCGYPPDSNHAMLVRRVLRRYAGDTGLFAKVSPPSEPQTSFLRTFDLGYGERRLRFVIAGLSHWYAQAGQPGYPARAELDACKGRLYAAIATLRSAMSEQAFGSELSAGIRSCFDERRIADFLAARGLDAEAFVVAHRDELDATVTGLRDVLERTLDGFSAGLYRDLEALTASWDAERRRDVLVRYFGFPFWDVLLYPIQALCDVGERDKVEVVRLSPHDATLLAPPAGERKVKGAARHHFGAFFSRPDRENDYLWGRLDGAEQLIRLLLPDDPELVAEWARRAFAAIVDEEAGTLIHIRPLVAHLRSQIAANEKASARLATPDGDVLQ